MTRTASRMRGFTLIEVLLATVLLAAGMALAFAIVRSTLTISTRGEAIASQNERMRGVENFLRRRLASAMPLPLDNNRIDGAAPVFQGDAQQMSFTADVPDYLGRGGPYVHTLQVSSKGQLKQLHIGLVLLQAGQQVPENPPRSMELLADELKEVRLRYRGIDPVRNGLGDWQPQWQAPGRMPMWVSIEVIPAKGAAWPPLVVALPQQGMVGSWR